MNTHIQTNTSTAEAISGQLIHLMHRAGQGGDDLFVKSFREYKLTPRQFAVLTAAQNRKAPSQAALVGDTGIDRSTLADIVGRLVDKGLIERHRTKKDARAYAIHVTEKGQAAIADLAPRLAKIERDVLSALPAEDRDDFLKNLEKIVHHLGDL